jgi:hypothetical protein
VPQRRRLSLVTLIILVLAGLLPAGLGPAASAALPLVLSLTQNGIVPADGQSHELTLSVTRGGTPLAATVQFDWGQGRTDQDGRFRFALWGTDNRTVSIGVVSATGESRQIYAVVLRPGYGAFDVTASSRSGASLSGYGYARTQANSYWRSCWISEDGEPCIVPAGAAVNVGLLSLRSADGDYYRLVSVGTATDQGRTPVHLDGADPGLGRFSITSALKPARLDFTGAGGIDDPGTLELNQDGPVTIWMPPGLWNLTLQSEQANANYGLSLLDRQVNPGEVTPVLFDTANLARIEATVLPGSLPPEVMEPVLHIYQQDTPELSVSMAKPAYVTPRTYASVNFGLRESRQGASNRYTLLPPAFPLMRPVTFAPGETYRFTAGGSGQSELTVDRAAYVGETVEANLRLKTPNGSMVINSQTDLTITDPDGVTTTVVGYGGSGYFAPQKAGTYHLTAVVLNPGPHATAAEATATLDLVVRFRRFRIDNAFDGRGTGRKYVLQGRSYADTLEYAVNDDQFVDVNTTWGPFLLTGDLPGDLPEGTAIPVRIRVKGDPASEERFTAVLDETPPTLKLSPVPLVVRNGFLTVAGTIFENLGYPNGGLLLEYTPDLLSPEPVWSSAIGSGYGGMIAFTTSVRLPMDHLAYRVRAAAIDLAGNQSAWQEHRVTMPTYTIEVTPANRTLQAGVPNTVSVRILEDGMPAEGMLVRIGSAWLRANAAGTAASTLVPAPGELVSVQIGSNPEIRLYAVPAGRAALEFSAVIDNHPDARPQAALNAAELVYETAVAPGITRFLGVFRSDLALAKIGPIRSARDSLVQLASGHGGGFAHAGGSNSALALTRESIDIVDLDEIYGSGDYFYRTEDRAAPHNLYTGTPQIRSGVAAQGVQPVGVPNGLPTGPMAGGIARDRVAVRFTGQTQDVAFAWDSAGGQYFRKEGGRPVLLEDGSPIAARNVVVLYATHRTFYRADVGEWEVAPTVLGSGVACVYRDGRMWTGRWSKPTPQDPITYTDENGDNMRFAEGTTWVLVADPGINPPPTGRISGHVLLEGREDHTGVSVELYGEDGLLTALTETDSTGQFWVATPKPGVYRITVVRFGWTLATRTGVVVGDGQTALLPSVTLLAGDMNFDGVVDSDDLGELINAYGSLPGQPAWRPEADLTPDGRVNLLDLFWIGRNQGRRPEWPE